MKTRQTGKQNSRNGVSKITKPYILVMLDNSYVEFDRVSHMTEYAIEHGVFPEFEDEVAGTMVYVATSVINNETF